VVEFVGGCRHCLDHFCKVTTRSGQIQRAVPCGHSSFAQLGFCCPELHPQSLHDHVVC